MSAPRSSHSTVPPRVALVTAAEARGLDGDAPLLQAALARRGIEAQACVWDDGAVDWSAWDLAVVRSTWDYPRRRDAFVRWAAAVQAVGALRNQHPVIAWNSDKRYLLDLAARGVAIVPSTVHGPGETIALPPDGPFVVKPTVSAGSQDTERYTADQHAQARAHGHRLHRRRRDVVVQPYVERVDDDGETALVYLGGRFSHAVRKGPILAGEPQMVGGLFAAEQIDRRIPSERERRAAEAALDAVPFDRAELLYARVDLLPGAGDVPLVLEVELVEPSLFLRFDDSAADRFAGLIAAQLGCPRRADGGRLWLSIDDEGSPAMSDERSLSDDDITNVTGGTDGPGTDADASDADASDGDAVDAVDGDAADADAADADASDGDAGDAVDGDAADADGADVDAHDA